MIGKAHDKYVQSFRYNNSVLTIWLEALSGRPKITLHQFYYNKKTAKYCNSPAILLYKKDLKNHRININNSVKPLFKVYDELLKQYKEKSEKQDKEYEVDDEQTIRDKARKRLRGEL